MQPFLQCIWQLNEKQFTPLALNFHNHITLTFQVPHLKLSKAHNLRHLPSSRVHFSPHPCRDGCSKGRSGTAVPLCQAQKILLCVNKSASEPDTLIHADDAPLTPEVLLLVLREPSPYQRHTSPSPSSPGVHLRPSSFSLTLHEGAFISSPLRIRDTVISSSLLLSLLLTKCTFL